MTVGRMLILSACLLAFHKLANIHPSWAHIAILGVIGVAFLMFEWRG